MPRIALNIICKNESHIIEKMLESVRPIIDLIVAVDTGSTDETIVLIGKFGNLYNIPTFVFERPFDNFSNSRNHAVDKLREVVKKQSLNEEEVWGFTIDCDEVLHISDGFEKDQLTDDLYLILVRQERDVFLRRSIFRISGNFHWENPVHEILTWGNSAIKMSTLQTLYVIPESKGASWRGNGEEKFLNYVRLLTEYADNGHRDFRTLFYVAESYRIAASYSKSKDNVNGYYLAAEKYYQQASQVEEDSIYNRSMVYYEFARNSAMLKKEWRTVQSLLLKSYNLAMRQAEGIAVIIRHYISEKQWNIAYLFSKFAYDVCHNTIPPLESTGGKIDINLYEWELLQYYYMTSYLTGRIQQAKLLRKQLMEYVSRNMAKFNIQQLIYIQYNGPFYLYFRSRISRLFGRK